MYRILSVLYICFRTVFNSETKNLEERLNLLTAFHIRSIKQSKLHRPYTQAACLPLSLPLFLSFSISLTVSPSCFSFLVSFNCPLSCTYFHFISDLFCQFAMFLPLTLFHPLLLPLSICLSLPLLPLSVVAVKSFRFVSIEFQ